MQLWNHKFIISNDHFHFLHIHHFHTTAPSLITCHSEKSCYRYQSPVTSYYLQVQFITEHPFVIVTKCHGFINENQEDHYFYHSDFIISSVFVHHSKNEDHLVWHIIITSKLRLLSQNISFFFLLPFKCY